VGALCSIVQVVQKPH